MLSRAISYTPYPPVCPSGRVGQARSARTIRRSSKVGGMQVWSVSMSRPTRVSATQASSGQTVKRSLTTVQVAPARAVREEYRVPAAQLVEVEEEQLAVRSRDTGPIAGEEYVFLVLAIPRVGRVWHVDYAPVERLFAVCVDNEYVVEPQNLYRQGGYGVGRHTVHYPTV